MPITVQDLTVKALHTVHRAALLSDWGWMIGPSRLPILVSAIGDAFVQDTDDGTVHQLDTAFAELEPVGAPPRTSCAASRSITNPRSSSSARSSSSLAANLLELRERRVELVDGAVSGVLDERIADRADEDREPRAPDHPLPIRQQRGAVDVLEVDGEVLDRDRHAWHATQTPVQ